MTKRFVPILIALLLVAAACGGSDADSATDDTQATPTTDAATTDTEAASDSAPETTVTEPAQAASGGGSGTATLVLDNGESYEFSILCALETQESAGQEILFTAVSYDKPFNLDVTKFGEDSFGGEASISVYDAESYDEVWSSSSGFSLETELKLNGSTITGSGMFVADGDAFGDQVRGELEANC